MDREDNFGGTGPGSSGGSPNLKQSLSEARVAAAIQVARFWGVDPDPREYRCPVEEKFPSSASLSAWLTQIGLFAKATTLKFSQLYRFNDGTPVVLMFTDGSAGILVGTNAERRVVMVRDPLQPETMPAVPVDELRLSQVWAGEVMLVRRERGGNVEHEPFGLGLIFQYVMREGPLIRDVVFASVAMAVTTVAPALLLMMILNEVLVYKTYATLNLVALLMVTMVLLEMALSWSRRELIVVISDRVDAQLGLMVMARVLRLSMVYFERTPVGQTMFNLNQLQKVRDFFTGKLLTTMLDAVVLVVLLPVLFLINAKLAAMIVASAVCIAIVILAFLPRLRYLTTRVVQAEVAKGTAQNENIYGIRTLKSLALEPVRMAEFDNLVAEAGHRRHDLLHLSNWPATIVMPFDFLAQRGVVLVGAYAYIAGDTSVTPGALIALMILGGRAAQPLVAIAKILEDLEEARTALRALASTVNEPPETRTPSEGLRPRFAGAVAFQNVTFTYPGSARPALKDISFEIPAGTMLGLVGRSGSGKSTITRLLQGINMEYTGSIKMDGADLKEINLAHLRRGFGVVLQENFLFRGTIRDNILAGRNGLTLEDAVRAARLAGADEFIEKLPAGYDSYIYEGSPNLSGGQRQRLAIARALVADPRLMVLDEATSALDPESEALVNANLLRIGRGRTMFIVSHRLSSLVESDLILVLDQGQVVDLAPHPVLLERCVIYRQLWQQQNRHAGGGGSRLALATEEAGE